MDFYNRNLSLLAKTQPDLASQIAAYNNPSANVEVLEAKDGSYTFKQNAGDNVYTAHSAYNPQKEASRMVDGYLKELKEFSNIVVLGGGFFYHIEELLKRTPGKFDFMLVVEYDVDVFKSALRCLDLSAVLGRPEIFFAVAEAPISVFQFLQGKGISIVANNLTILKHGTLCKMNPYYSEVEKQVKDVFTWAKVNISAQVKTTDTYCRNIFANIPHVLKNPGVKNIFEFFKDIPAVVVAAGPSLSKNIAYLKRVQNNFLIVAVDTALKVLLQNEIEPHFVVSIDYTPDNLRYFKGVGKINTYLLADPEVYPDIFASYQGPKIAIDLQNKSLCYWLHRQGIDKGSLSKGLSVAHTCYEVAVAAGCSPIAFIGQDLAYTGGLSHSKGAAMTVAVDKDNLTEGMVKVEDIFGGEIVTSTSMSVFLNHFMEKIYTHKVLTVDATEGGAKIAGSVNMPLKRFIADYKEKGCTDIWAKISEAVVLEDADIASIKENALKTAKAFGKFAEFAEKGRELMEQLLKEIDKKEIDVKQVSKHLGNWRDISKNMHLYDELLKIIRDNITDALVVQAKKSLVITSLGDLRQETEKKKILKTADRDRFFYGRIAESASFMAEQFEKLNGRF